MKIDLEKFVETYVREAFRISKENPVLDYFDDKIRNSVAKKMSLSENFIKYIHHAFHWEFFCNENFILEYVQICKNGENNFVRLKTSPTNKDIKNLKNLILDKYKEYLKARISSYRE